MTRWARAGNSQKHKKMPEDPTSWEELSKGVKNSPKSKTKQNDPKEHKSLGNIRTVKKGFKDSKKLCKVELFNKNCINHQIIEENFFVSNSVEKDSSCDVLKNPEECKPEERTMSKRQLKKLKRQERKKLKTDSNPEFECTSDTGNMCKIVSSSNFAEENKDCNETLKLKSTEPISANKSDRVNLLESHQKGVNSNPIDKKLRKKEKFMKKLQEKRLQNGITLLSRTAENRLYRIKKRLREKGYTPEMIKDIIRKERRKAELEFRKTSFTKTCFNCGQPGHFRAECDVSPNKTDQEIHTCLKCGSVEHNSIECTEKVFGQSFLTCFVCKGQGHISRDCPDKKRAVKEEEEEPLVALPTINEGESIDDEVVAVKKNIEKPKFKKPKVVVF